MASVGGDKLAVCSTGATSSGNRHVLRRVWNQIKSDSQTGQLFATVLTTFAVFGVFLVQGIIVARILGPTGRGEFGTALYFPRDILLYVGLLGAMDIVTSYAARRRANPTELRFTAARLGMMTGVATAVVAAVMSIALLVLTQKQYLIPFALICCLFLPWEHMQLAITSVDRGLGNYFRYNLNRFLFAISFPAILLVAWLVDLGQLTGVSWLWLACGLFVVSKMIGLVPAVYGMKLLSRIRESRRGGGDVKRFDNEPTARKLLKEGRPYAISMFVTELFERLDIFLVLALATVMESGYYFVAVPAAALLIVVPNALGVFTFNVGANSNVRVTPVLAAKVMGATAAFQILATLIFALILEQLILLFYGQDFAPAVPFALWLLPACAIKGFLQAADGYLKGRQKPMIGVWARGFSIFVMLAFLAVMYERLGLISVPIAACVGQAFAFCVIVAAIFVDVNENRDASSAGSAA